MNFENNVAQIADDAVVEIRNLTKKYGTKKAVDNVSFKVRRGEILGFLGPNGAGKSTTMNILTGYISATDGEVRVDGVDVLENPKAVKQKIGYLPENPPLYFDMTVREYLKFVYELKGVKKPEKEHLDEVMNVVKITHAADRMIKNLSKGYKQRVGLAQALIGDPEVLVLDEPTVGLDPKQIIDIRNVICEIGKSRTVILSTHILQEVSAVCDRVAIINRGRLVALDTLEALSEAFGEKGKFVIRAVGDAARVKEILGCVSGMKFFGFVGSFEVDTVDFVLEFENGLDLRREVFEAFAKAGVPLIGFRSTELSLEEIFIKVTNNSESVREVSEKSSDNRKKTEDNKTATNGSDKKDEADGEAKKQ